MSITALALCTLSLLPGQGNETIAMINGEAVTAKNYYRRMEYLPGLGRRAPTGQFIEIMPSIATLDAIVTETLILQIAKSKGLLPTESEVDQEVAYRVRKNPTFVPDWQSFGRTLAELRYMIRVEKAQFKIQTDGIVVTESDVQRNYDASKVARFTYPDRVRLHVIIVNDEDSKSKVDSGLNSGKKFEDLARDYSSDPSKIAGGEFGVLPVDLLGEEVKAAIKDLKAGGRTKWLGKEGVYAMFQVDGFVPKAVMPLDTGLKEDIRREMMLLKGSSQVDIAKLIRQARDAAKISITSPDIDKAYKQFAELGKKAASGG